MLRAIQLLPEGLKLCAREATILAESSILHYLTNQLQNRRCGI
jgi:hypothetical protein